MGKPTGFLEITRHEHGYAPVEERVTHFRDFVVPLPESGVREQAARCMDCGIPYCHRGCPVHNIIPDWNDLVYRGNWREALEVLHSTNNFPEFTGRICPAPCEASCTLNFNNQPVTIKDIECAIIDKGWAEGWVQPQIAAHRTGKRVAVVGSGPSGLACAQQLARAGHDVVVFEKNDRIGGLLRYGIPDFKLETRLIDRRLAQMRAEGVEFRPNSHVGVDIPARALLAEFDAVVLAGGSEQPRDLNVPGRELRGIHFAMDFLTQQNRRVAGVKIAGRGNPGDRQGRGGHRRRRYRFRLRGHLDPPGRAFRHPTGNPAQAAAAREQAADLAQLAAEAAHLHFPRGRLRTGLGGDHETVYRSGRPTDRDASRAAGMARK